MKHNKIIISILTIFIILLSVGCSNKQENIPDSNENVNADYEMCIRDRARPSNSVRMPIDSL